KLTDFDLVGGAHTTGGTRTGALGTFVYAAPEAMERPQDAKPAADVYGLGMTALFCFYGKDLPAKVMRDAGKVIRGLSCSGDGKAALERAVEWEVEDRFADVAAFCGALQACAREPVREPAGAMIAVMLDELRGIAPVADAERPSKGNAERLS